MPSSLIASAAISLVSQLVANGVLHDEFVVLLRRIAQHHPHLLLPGDIRTDAALHVHLPYPLAIDRSTTVLLQAISRAMDQTIERVASSTTLSISFQNQ
uniref:Uncharacterized protein n=1 Tax=Pristionchus pacificus TaxID=54126 RepID=A0A2A6BU82_PRIPA|eukprot:PDM69366.1 hypothetical protein PRIPAC_47668 [Pristionchus pacificus]